MRSSPFRHYVVAGQLFWAPADIPCDGWRENNVRHEPHYWDLAFPGGKGVLCLGTYVDLGSEGVDADIPFWASEPGTRR